MAEKPTFPPEHRKRKYQGIAAFLIILSCLGGWVHLKAESTLEHLEKDTPFAQALLKKVYLTPQITDNAKNPFDMSGAKDGKIVHIALIMTDLGLTENATKRAIHDLPDAVALSFSPYSSSITDWIEQSRHRKHETLVLLPMETKKYPREDSGPKTLLTRISQKENIQSLSTILKGTNKAVGTMNFMGSRFLSDVKNLSAIFRTLKRRNLFFIERREKTSTLAAIVAQETNTPYLLTDLNIDKSATEIDIGQKLLELERIARKQGYAIGVMEPYPVTFNMVKAWLDSIDRRNVRLVPLSFIIKTKAMHEQQQHLQ